MLDTTDNSIVEIQADVNKATAAIETIILGKTEQVKLAVCCLIARGHCLIEDLPGVGKTTIVSSTSVYITRIQPRARRGQSSPGSHSFSGTD